MYRLEVGGLGVIAQVRNRRVGVIVQVRDRRVGGHCTG